MRKKIMTGSFDFPEDEWSQISEMAKDIVRKWVLFMFSLFYPAAEWGDLQISYMLIFVTLYNS